MDNEVKGEGNSYDFGARFHDPRVGRWLSLDAVHKDYQSNYAYSSNNPIIFIDKGGNDDYYYDRETHSVYVVRNGAPHRFIFTEYIYSDPDANGFQYGEAVNIIYPLSSDKVKGLFYRNNNVFRDALHTTNSREDFERIYNSYENLGNREAAKLIGVVAAAPAVLVVGLEVLAYYGGETIATFVLNEAKDEVLSQATGGASDVLDVTKLAVKGVKNIGKRVLKNIDTSPGIILPDNEIIVMGTNAEKSGAFKLRDGIDNKPIGNVIQSGKSASIATTLKLNDELKVMFGKDRVISRHDRLSGASVGDVRAAGFDVLYAPTPSNPFHVRIVPDINKYDENGRDWLSNAFDMLEKGRKAKKKTN